MMHASACVGRNPSPSYNHKHKRTEQGVHPPLERRHQRANPPDGRQAHPPVLVQQEGARVVVVVVGPGPAPVVVLVLRGVVGLLQRARGEEEGVGGDLRAVADEGLCGLIWAVGVWWMDGWIWRWMDRQANNRGDTHTHT